MLVSVNSTDITEYINPKNYSMNEEAQYQSWKDGNYREHRIYSRPRVKGSFEVALYGQNDMDAEAFLTLWNGAVNNHVVTMLVYVQNTDSNKAINAFFNFKGKFHREMINGEYCNVLTIEIQER